MNNWEIDYKVRYVRIDGTFHCSEWDNERGARKFFEGLKNEKEPVTEWAELIWAPIDTDPDWGEKIIDDFQREKVELLGHVLLVPLRK